MTSYRGNEAIDWFGFSRLWSQTVGYAVTTSRIDSLNRRKTLNESLASARLLFCDKEDDVYGKQWSQITVWCGSCVERTDRILPAMRMMSQMNMNMSPEEMLAQPYFILAMILTLLGLPFLILTLIWMFNALKVSCNLKQWKLWTVALIGIIGGDVLCRFLIGWLY